MAANLFQSPLDGDIRLTSSYIELSPSQLRESRTNPRKSFDDIEELALSIRQKGIISPLAVRKSGAGFEIIAGARRYRAALKAGCTTIPCVIRSDHEVAALEVQLVENIQRKKLSAFEEAEAYQTMLASGSYNANFIASKLGVPVQRVWQRLKLLELNDDQREALRVGKINPSLANALARIPRDEQNETLEELKSKGIATARLALRETQQRRLEAGEKRAKPRSTKRSAAAKRMIEICNGKLDERQERIISDAVAALESLPVEDTVSASLG